MNDRHLKPKTLNLRLPAPLRARLDHLAKQMHHAYRAGHPLLDTSRPTLSATAREALRRGIAALEEELARAPPQTRLTIPTLTLT